MEYFKILPEEIILHILTRVPTESVLNCKLVCKNWRNIISHHPQFSKMHFQHLNHSPSASDSGKFGFLALDDEHKNFWYFEYNENDHDQSAPIQRIIRVKLTSPFRMYTIISGSCNGLICLSCSLSVCICNPINKEYVRLPELVRACDNRPFMYAVSSFGYVSSTNDYKVVGICVWKTHIEVHVYTLGSGIGWRNLGRFNFGCDPHISRSVFFANGALYWKDYRSKMIITFDLAEEKFCEHLPPPPLPPGNDWISNVIGVLDGVLFFAVCLYDEGDGLNDIWLLKKKKNHHDMKEQKDCQSMVWSREFRVDRNKLIAVTKSGGVLTYVDNYINIYDTKTLTSKTILDFKEWFDQVSPHKNTLVSLKELGEEVTKTTESVEIEETERPYPPLKLLHEHVNPE